MRLTAGIDVGSTYTKAVIVDEEYGTVGRAIGRTGFRLAEVARRTFEAALADARVAEADVAYVMSTGYGRFQVDFRDLQITDLTAASRGARLAFPGTRTVLDVGGQTVKVSRLDARGLVKSFRLNDKCATGTGAFLEKTARYLGYTTEEIGPLADVSRQPVTISGVCAVFAESEVINQLSLGAAAADIMQGAIESLVGRAVQLMRRAQMEPEFTLVGGILRFPSMARLMRDTLGAHVNIPSEADVQFVAALGAAALAHRRASRAAGEVRTGDAAATD